MRSIAVLAGLLLLPGPLLAADNGTSAPDAVFEGSSIVEDGPLPENWGAAATSFVALPAWSARPIDSTATYGFTNTPGGQGIFRTAGTMFFKIPVHVPAGAIVEAVELNYCDTGAGAITASWFRQPKNAGTFVTLLHTSSGTPGCIVQNALLTPAQTIDNNANSYHIELAMGSADNTIVFLSARVGYRLQVSAAPAVATFPLDVPTSHPFFRFVEALAASGVTSGCGAQLFCPDAPVTRGQMAVFLATALGMHFPN